MQEKCNWLCDERHTTFLGLTMQQRWVDLVVWEHVLNAHKGLRTIIELGTGRGSFSIYLLLQAIQRDMEFWTFDRNMRIVADRTPAARMLGLQEHFHEVDIFKDGKPTVLAIINTPEAHPLLLFCDNGWKQEEFGIFAPRLLQGDIVGVHDWMTEFREEHTEFMRERLEPLFFDECESLCSITRFWEVVA